MDRGDSREAIERILREAAALDPADQIAYLEDACRDDPALLDELTSRLRAGGFVPRRIGPYRVLSVLGEGGMGTVYLAEEQHPMRRRVALKIVRSDLHAGEMLARFERERQALALMEHSGIARVYGTGTTRRGRPYFVMEYVDGIPITRFCDERTLGLPRRLELFIKVCLAVHHAHQKGIIHRDLKPTNVLVADEDGGSPKVIDFGVARAVEAGAAPERTSEAVIVGTLEHMSPEQATPGSKDVDTRSDVYALGVLLYELLSGRRPFELRSREVGALADLQRRIVEEPTRPPSAAVDAGAAAARGTSRRALARAIAGDLDWIALKALEKDPRHRYASASELAADVQRYLFSEPVLAGPPSLAYRARRFVVRRRGLVAAAAIVGLVAILGAAVWVREHEVAEERLADYRNLADRLLLDDFKKRADTLWPTWPENIPRMEVWIDGASRLAVRTEFHARRLQEMRRRARVETVAPPAGGRLDDLVAVRDALRKELAAMSPSGEADFVAMKLKQAEDQIAALRADAARAQRYVFDLPEDQKLHDQLAALVLDLRTLGDPDRGLIADMRRRIAQIHALERATLDDATAEWAAAAAAIAASPRYAGLAVTPQIGLVPLGADPISGLYEFLHWRSGERPVRRADGRYVIAPETGMVLVLIPGGSFTMGTDRGSDPLAWRAEGPPHRVTLAPFFLSKYEMTRGQWRRVAASDPSLFTPPRAPTETERALHDVQPVDQVYWQQSHDVLARIGLELPTEAQWEYAARGGTTTRWYTGDDPRSLAGHANLHDLAALRAERGTAYARYESWLDDGFAALAPVGSLLPNPFGLHDVAGNVGEWCRDWFQVYDCPVRPETGERIPVDDGPMRRVMRGGGRGSLATMARVTAREHIDPSIAEVGAGLRPSRRLVPPEGE
ncbi:MAG TPA: bifunctional serine/threonine-protein kinase/formylglycine-generating enzyme family protein [Candidatus Polarisedimenticolaceae bacterium]|nr:bifunctional serine/threonine-protein kinase/formylglycine-generating enzyme family protein [Candidatus Polarisedimenticolaceae bacterium]